MKLIQEEQQQVCVCVCVIECICVRECVFVIRFFRVEQGSCPVRSQHPDITTKTGIMDRGRTCSLLAAL